MSDNRKNESMHNADDNYINFMQCNFRVIFGMVLDNSKSNSTLIS